MSAPALPKKVPKCKHCEVTLESFAKLFVHEPRCDPSTFANRRPSVAPFAQTISPLKAQVVRHVADPSLLRQASLDPEEDGEPLYTQPYTKFSQEAKEVAAGEPVPLGESQVGPHADNEIPDNLIRLPELTQPVLVEALEKRYEADKIYSAVGDILIAVNPLRLINSLYDQETMTRYLHHRDATHEPHIFGVAQLAYEQLQQLRMSQCILISGESGAGKTETARHFLQHLLRLESSGGLAGLERAISDGEPLLEAFGNASTALNPNSSRFGKYIELCFSNEPTFDPRLLGARVQIHLLEKSRIAAREGRTFHIFYLMLATLDETKASRLQLCQSDYAFLPGDWDTAEAAVDAATYADVRQAAETIGLDADFEEIEAVLSAVLNLGNLEFGQRGDDGSIIQGTTCVSAVAQQLGVAVEDLSQALTSRCVITRKESVEVPLDPEGAVCVADTLATELYDAMFRWLVKSMNHRLGHSYSKLENSSDPIVIGILDLFGFEAFERNGFEQLCINTANEQLQFFFGQHIFKNELDEYKKEGVQAPEVGFEQNTGQMDLLLGRPLGIFAIIDEEVRLGNCRDEHLVSKLHRCFGKHPLYQERGAVIQSFGVIHYAGLVDYSVRSFLDINRNSGSSILTRLLAQSRRPIVASMAASIAGDARIQGLNADQAAGVHDGKRANHFLNKARRIMSPSNFKSSPKSCRAAISLGSQFRQSLRMLMQRVTSAVPHFVRCLKPNVCQKPRIFDSPVVARQLRYTGVLETVRIRKAGYSVRYPFVKFWELYGSLAESQIAVRTPNAVLCEALLKAQDIEGWRIGRTKVFLKFTATQRLLQLLTGKKQKVVMVQSCVRRWVAVRRMEQRRLQRKQAATSPLSATTTVAEPSEASMKSAPTVAMEPQGESPSPPTPPPPRCKPRKSEDLETQLQSNIKLRRLLTGCRYKQTEFGGIRALFESGQEGTSSQKLTGKKAATAAMLQEELNRDSTKEKFTVQKVARPSNVLTTPTCRKCGESFESFAHTLRHEVLCGTELEHSKPKETSSSSTTEPHLPPRAKPRESLVAFAILEPPPDAPPAPQPIQSDKKPRPSVWKPSPSIRAEVMPFDVDEFESLDQNFADRHVVPSGCEHLNRYTNILPNKCSQVPLKVRGGDLRTGYINANFIRGPDKASRRYIATQGPLTDTVDDFWRMVWEQNVRTIVMVTHEVERGQIKCARYWPRLLYNEDLQVGDQVFGDFNVRILSGYRRKGYITSNLRVRAPSGKQREIKHFWFDKWPDHGVPAKGQPIVHMLKACHDWNGRDGPPWVVHCSAGIGRTGTFIAIDHGINILKTQAEANVNRIIAQLREDRGGMVQHVEQAQFVHSTLVEAAKALVAGTY